MLCVTAVLSAAGGALCLARGNERRFYDVSKRLFVAAAASGGLVLIAILFLLVIHDYRVEYVRDYADRTMSLGFLLTAVWGGQQGSLALWAVLQTWYTAAAAVWFGKREPTGAPVAFGFLAAIQVFFLLLVLFHSNPFDPLGTTASHGVGLNPLLRNFYMVFHPPTLFLGFVGFSVPMAFALAALVNGNLDSGWLVSQRPWILFAWLFLSIGNILGMVWAYEELGWGGYWGWDPVENASFMPWLTATALVHSAMAEERRGIMRRWNILLLVFTFQLIIFGTFLTRSGVIESVHAFAGATTGPYFLGLMVASGTLPIALIFVRMFALAPKRSISSMLSREWALLVGNWVFMAATVFVWVATMMPLFSELFSGEKITLTPAFFNRWMVPIGLVVLGLMGMCTIMGWRGQKPNESLGRFAMPVFVGVFAGTLSVFFGSWRPDLGGPMSAAPAISIGLVAMVAASLARSLRLTILESGKAGHTPGRIRRRFGGQLVHLSMVLMFVGFTGSGFTQEVQGSMGPGDHLNIAGYRVGFIGLRWDRDFEREAVFADLEIRDPGGKTMGVLSPARFVYHSHPGQPTSEVVIETDLAGDLFLILGETDEARGRAVIRAVVNPLVVWIWLGGVLLVLGTLVAFIRPGAFLAVLEMKRETRSRYAGAVVVIGTAFTAALVAGLVRNMPAAIAVLGALTLLAAIHQFAGALSGLIRDGGGR